MKIICVGYTDDFARFFLATKKKLLLKNKKIKFYYLSIYFSGFIYFFLRLQRVDFFSFRVWVNQLINKKKYLLIVKKNATYRGVNINLVIRFHKFVDPESELKLKLQAVSYIDVISEYLVKVNPDILILSGDTRMCIEVFDILGKKKNICTHYFEQGPFGTTIFDEKGVNSNASIRNRSIESSKMSVKELEFKVSSFYKRKRDRKYKRNSFYRGMDYLIQKIFCKTGVLPIDIKIVKQSKHVGYLYNRLEINEDVENVFLLILQVPQDANMTHHSPFYKSHYSIIKDVFENLPKGYNLVVREHPLYKSRYEKELYSYMQDKKIALDKKDLYESINNATVVVVNNSTVGIEAISRYKTVVVLGDAYYDSDMICLKLNSVVQLGELLNKALEYKPNKVIVNNFLYHFLYNYLIDGHFRDKNLNATEIIVENLID